MTCATKTVNQKSMCSQTYSIGILAYGSLIDDPGAELSPYIIDRIKTSTPFRVEYKRSSATRGGAPTLIPVEQGGKAVTAVILVLDNTIDLNQAKTMLWKRERRSSNANETYREPENSTLNAVLVRELRRFCNVDTVLYTMIGQNIPEPVTPTILAEKAIASIRSHKIQNGKDGISYLLSAKNNGIVTELSEAYEQEILRLTNTMSLEEAIASRGQQPGVPSN